MTTETIAITTEYSSLKRELVELYQLRDSIQRSYAKIKLERESNIGVEGLLCKSRDTYKDINLAIISRELRFKTVVDFMDMAQSFEALIS